MKPLPMNPTPDPTTGTEWLAKGAEYLDFLKEAQATIDHLKGEKADIQQESDRLRALLTVFVEREHGEPCRFDHHGYCQAHFLEEGVNCSVYQGRALLGLDTLNV